MGSSAKTEKLFFCGSQEHFLHKCAIWDRTPPTYTSNAVYMCVGGFKGPKSSNGIQYLNSFKSYGNFSDFVVPTWSTWSPHHPCHSHIIPIIPTSSPYHPLCLHIIPIAPRRSPCGPHGCGLCGLHPMLSPLSPCHPCHPHMIPHIV